ncbi:multicopper oxidase family protein [Pseudokineococcus sp. 5B2Z-1]|uniref:multicopper oxidase family protein n=1 Tax=Pseudokineococcus sp. 5B2Z-1 TaxID=3132744 RepID=UPI0030AE543D
METTRREVLGLGALGALGAAGLAVPLRRPVEAKSASTLAPRNFPKPYTAAFTRPPVLPHTVHEDAEGPYRLYTVTERVASASILPGLSTPVAGYDGTVPGPTIRVPQGVRAKLRVRNQLPAVHPGFGHPFATSTHLHGSASLPQYDGYADDVTPPGSYKDYWYPNWQPARTLWYHDHQVHTTSNNAYWGLYAQYQMTDPAEQALLPQGDYDVPLVVADAMFAADGRLAWDDNGHSGLWGDVVLVNGRPWPVMKVRRRIYRFRVLVSSISRSYRFKLSNGAPLVVVATDGGLVPKAQPVTSYRHAGAERYEVLVDFSRYAPGTSIDLVNLSNKNNVDYDHTGKVMRFTVVADGDLPPDSPGSRTLAAMPDLLVPSEPMLLRPEDATNKLRMRLERDDTTNLFEINGRSWEEVQDSDYRRVLTAAEIGEVGLWEVENRTGGGWFHPLHVHLVDFRVLSRNGKAPFAHEQGPKDVVYVGEAETVQLLMRFSTRPAGETTAGTGGRYMVHCHNLAHEDHDMMHQFSVGDPELNDPLTSAPPRVDDGVYDDGEPVG